MRLVLLFLRWLFPFSRQQRRYLPTKIILPLFPFFPCSSSSSSFSLHKNAPLSTSTKLFLLLLSSSVAGVSSQHQQHQECPAEECCLRPPPPHSSLLSGELLISRRQLTWLLLLFTASYAHGCNNKLAAPANAQEIKARIFGPSSGVLLRALTFCAKISPCCIFEHYF